MALKSFSKGLERSWKSASSSVSKAADKGFDKVSHATFDRSDHWHAEYPQDEETYDLRLRRDKSRASDGLARTGRFKFSFEQEVHVRYEVHDGEDVRTGNGCYIVPRGFMDLRCTHKPDTEPPIFLVEMHVPTTGSDKAGSKTAVRGNKECFEMYLPTKEKKEKKEKKDKKD